MERVDNVAVKLNAARLHTQERLKAAATKRCTKVCDIDGNLLTTVKRFLVASYKPCSKYNNTIPWRGRYCWFCKTKQAVDTNLPWIARAASLPDYDLAEWACWIEATGLVHHESLKRLLKLAGVETLYCHGTTRSRLLDACKQLGVIIIGEHIA